MRQVLSWSSLKKNGWSWIGNRRKFKKVAYDYTAASVGVDVPAEAKLRTSPFRSVNFSLLLDAMQTEVCTPQFGFREKNL
jgi:hypothetical protein